MAKHTILILGATGHLGQVLLKESLDQDYLITILVRSPEKLSLTHKNLTILKGDVTKASDVESALKGVNAVISVLGHGFRTQFPIQEKTLEVVLPLMKEKKITRLITITGSALLEPDDPPSLLGPSIERLAASIDPYRLEDARKQAEMLRASDLEWTVVRTPVHREGKSTKLNSVGCHQPPLWATVTRKAIAAFMLTSLEKHEWIRQAPIITN